MRKNRYMIILGLTTALVIFFVSSSYIRLTPLFYIIPTFLILFGIISYTKLNKKWVAVISLGVIAIVVLILVFFSWMSTHPFSGFIT